MGDDINTLLEQMPEAYSDKLQLMENILKKGLQKLLR
jgi:hypothetical protein